MSWGKGITLTIIVFVGLMSFLVYKCIGVRTELVNSNYYENALNFDEVQIAKSNYSRMASPVKIEKTDDFITLNIPYAEGADISEVKLELYFPADKKHDRYIDRQESTIVLSRDQLQSGFYRTSLYWNAGANEYLFEGSFIN